MPKTSSTRARRWPLAGWIAVTVCLAIGVAAAQQPTPRERDPAAEANRDPSRTEPSIVQQPGLESGERTGREGGIPRTMSREREADRKEGSEEGVPEIQAQPELRSGQPRWAPPRGDWKLGVWGYNTETGVVITRVQPGSAAERSGLERGDRVVGIGGYQVGYVGDLLYPLGYELQRQAGRRGDVLLLMQNVRNNELQNLTVQLDRGGSFRPLPRDRDVQE